LISAVPGLVAVSDATFDQVLNMTASHRDRPPAIETAMHFNPGFPKTSGGWFAMGCREEVFARRVPL
jgi:hypothetical protein